MKMVQVQVQVQVQVTGARVVVSHHSEGVGLGNQRWGSIDAFEVWRACGHTHCTHNKREMQFLCNQGKQMPLLVHRKLGKHGQVVVVTAELLLLQLVLVLVLLLLLLLLSTMAMKVESLH
jgi:hypothetical protein